MLNFYGVKYMTKKRIILISFLVIVSIILYFADIRISTTAFVVILLFVWALIIDSKFSKLKSTLGEKINQIEEKIGNKREEGEVEKITSYICSMSISFNEIYLTNMMKKLGFDPQEDFDYSNYKGGFAFQQIKDFVSGLEFINRDGNIFSTNYLFSDISFKEGVLKRKYPDQPLIEIGYTSFVRIALKEGKIEFLRFDHNEPNLRNMVKLIGLFPYNYFINELRKFHEMDFSEGVEEEKKIEMEKSLLNQEKFKDWKVTKRIEPSISDINLYHVIYDEVWQDYTFESDYATINLHFEPKYKT